MIASEPEDDVLAAAAAQLGARISFGRARRAIDMGRAVRARRAVGVSRAVGIRRTIGIGGAVGIRRTIGGGGFPRGKFLRGGRVLCPDGKGCIFRAPPGGGGRLFLLLHMLRSLRGFYIIVP